MNTALLVIDVQQSFLHRPYWRDEEAAAFRDRLLALVAGCRARGVPVVHVLHEEPGSGGPFDPASGHVRELDWLDGEPDARFRKRVHSAMVGTGLPEWLRARGLGHLVVSGIRTEQCCETTTRNASDLGFEVTYVTEATLTFPMTHSSGRTYSAAELRERTELVLDGRFARIATVAEALAGLDAEERPAAP
ncbi:isochorismatase family protein [Anaeromyxobacter paludicola]|uniref:Hydrolase n=1 Tax=Anaeromyxobacter paludicola TaxID=2918171 RepID=A0ABN6N9V2_9BACT|nr:isochorismatase family protein [Anaeromyxobacter paludicola]BDG10025.1 hydrolase [Anaeromyxobacter paludicola]